MFTLVTCIVAGFLLGTEAQPNTIPSNWYTALVPVNIKCNADPVKGLVCAAEYAEKCKEQWNFPNPCTAENLDMNITKFIHPLDTTRFLMCGDLGKLYVVQCPQFEVFHEGCGQCVGESTGFDASCEIPLTPMIKNPCTKESILANKLFFAFPGNLNKFIHCDVWGKAWERTCSIDQVWSQYDVACVPAATVNPCSRPNANYNILYQHPCNPYKYLRCDVNGFAYEVTCPTGTAFIETAQACQPLVSLSYQPEVYCRQHIFNFRAYDPSINLGVPKGVPSISVVPIGSVPVAGSQTVSIVNTGQIGTQPVPKNVRNLGMSTELTSIVDAWKTNVNVAPIKITSGASDRLTISKNFASTVGAGTAGMTGGVESLKLDPMDIASSVGGLKNGVAVAATVSGNSPFDIIADPILDITRGVNNANIRGSIQRAPDGTLASVTGINDVSAGFNSLSGGMGDIRGTVHNMPIVHSTNGGSIMVNALNRAITGTSGSIGIGASDSLGLTGNVNNLSGATKPIDNLGVSTIHPAQLEEYTYSTIRWAAPCTPDNILNGRFHFKYKGDAHSYIQCDAHGNMFKRPCSKDETSIGYFDVYTSTCVDGPVHVPERDLAGTNASSMAFNNIFLNSFQPGGTSQAATAI